MVKVRHKLHPADLQSRMHSHDAKMRSEKSLKTSSTEKISNINYEADVNHALRYTRGFCSLIGVWSMVSGNPTKIEKNVSKFLIPACLMSSAFILTPPICYLIINEENVMTQLVICTPVSYFFGTLVKYIFIIFRRRMIKFCIEHVRADWMMIDSEKGRAIMKMNIKVGNDITVICSVFLYSCGFFLHAGMPLLSPKVINEFNETVRPLAYPGYDHFYDSQSSPNYEITYFTILISIFVGYNVSNAVCNFAAIFVTHTCGQVQILVSRIGRLTEEFNECDKSINERLSFIVRSHVRALRNLSKLTEVTENSVREGTFELSSNTHCSIYFPLSLYSSSEVLGKCLWSINRFASNIEIILAEICFIELFASMIIICLAEYCFVMELKHMDAWRLFTYFSCLVSLIWNVYIYCHIGELLKEQFQKIGVAAYMVQWYRFPSKIGVDIIMIMLMASSPRQITAGNMMELSMNSFANIMKTLMTYFNMLRQLTD